jgi:hypothetical protein
VYYTCAFKSWERHAKRRLENLAHQTGEAGLSAISVNTYICAMNACWKWPGRS